MFWYYQVLVLEYWYNKVATQKQHKNNIISSLISWSQTYFLWNSWIPCFKYRKYNLGLGDEHLVISFFVSFFFFFCRRAYWYLINQHKVLYLLFAYQKDRLDIDLALWVFLDCARCVYCFVGFQQNCKNNNNFNNLFSGKEFQLCLPAVHFLAAWLYLSVFPFGGRGLMRIWLYQFLSLLI